MISKQDAIAIEVAFDRAQARCELSGLADTLTVILLSYAPDEEARRFLYAIVTTSVAGRDEGFLWPKRSRAWIVRAAIEAARNPDMRAAFLTVIVGDYGS